LHPIELAITDAAQECVPLGRGKSKDRTFGVLAVADSDELARQAGYFDAATVCLTYGAFSPVYR